ncbi:MAG: histidine phosphotransferase family protein [Marivita sp.]|uniref:histidine phosphotransferase family protein n=1 Tax=Marivita sp. TaxID=2003365 RepID=UPI003EF8C3F9
MQQDDASLAALIGSRICHDLINPIGAISNGLELVGMGGASPGGPEMSLIQQSCDNATSLIRFFRIAFGSYCDTPMISDREARQTVTDHYAGTRITADWQIDGDVPRNVVQLGYLSALCLEAALPLGGQLIIDQHGHDIVATARADTLRTDAAVWGLLTGECGAQNDMDLRPSDVQFVLLSHLCRDRGIPIALTHGQNHIALAVTLPAGTG